MLELRQEHAIAPENVERVDVETFDVAYNIIGGGEEGDKYVVHTKEEADHSLQYMVAVALLDGEVTPAQYAPERIERQDVQELLRRVVVRPSEAFSRRFPDEMPCRITIRLRDGRELVQLKSDYEGFSTNPMRWETIVHKFASLTSPYADAALRKQIVDAVFGIEELQVVDLVRLLAQVRRPAEQVRAA